MSLSTGANAGTDAGVQCTKIPSLASLHQAGTRCRRTESVSPREPGTRLGPRLSVPLWAGDG